MVSAGCRTVFALGDFKLLCFQSFAQSLAHFANQEVKGHVTDIFLILQGVGHDDDIGYPAAVQPIRLARRQVELGQGLSQYPG